MSELVIISMRASNFGRAVVMTAEEKGVPYIFQKSGPHAPDVAAIHPLGKVPVMRHGDVELYESAAIARYIDTVFDGPKLFPAEPAQAALVDQWVSLTNTVIDPTMIRRYLFAYIFYGNPDGTPNMTVVNECLQPMQKQLDIIEGGLAATGWLVGEGITYADINLFCTLHYMRELPETAAMLRDRPNISAWMDRIYARDSAAATKQDPAWPRPVKA
ncbi:MAG: glutathione S-transferase family protein [Alphaproteobacteria bacterium]|nr:MAG: glutathione S-transferase family protein [Alphaproteobacteria bacterium]